MKKRDLTPKREPLLADLFLAAPENDLIRPTPRSLIPRLKDELLTAKRWVFDNTAATYFGEMISKAPEAIAYAQEFAIPPFTNMWVEFPLPPVTKAILEGRTPQQEIMAPEDRDTRLAYFYVGPNVYVFSEARGKPGIMPIYYSMNQPHDLEEEWEFARVLSVSRIQLDLFYWGKVADDFLKQRSEKAAFDNSCLPMLRQNHAARFMGGGYKESLERSPIATKDRFLHGGSGDLRNIIAIPLLLNRSSRTTYEEVIGPKQQMLHNKARTYVGHSIIKFKVNPVPNIKKILIGAGGAWRRRHDVRGHFCYNKTSWAAMHHMEPELVEGYHPPEWKASKHNQWQCMTCGGLKWHRREHERGKLDKGIVISQYDVTEKT